jgi:hypothetical protein
MEMKNCWRYHFLCGPCRIKGKYEISSSQNFLSSLWDLTSVHTYPVQVPLIICNLNNVISFYVLNSVGPISINITCFIANCLLANQKRCKSGAVDCVGGGVLYFLAYCPYFEKNKRRLMRSPCCLCHSLIFLFSMQSMSYQRKAGN